MVQLSDIDIVQLSWHWWLQLDNHKQSCKYKARIIKWRRALRDLHDSVVEYHFAMSHDYRCVISCSLFFFIILKRITSNQSNVTCSTKWIDKVWSAASAEPKNVLISFWISNSFQYLYSLHQKMQDLNQVNCKAYFYFQIFNAWLCQWTRKNECNFYEIKLRKNSKREVEVLKCVVRFVQHTKRFKKKNLENYAFGVACCYLFFHHWYGDNTSGNLMVTFWLDTHNLHFEVCHNT